MLSASDILHICAEVESNSEFGISGFWNSQGESAKAVSSVLDFLEVSPDDRPMFEAGMCIGYGFGKAVGHMSTPISDN